MTEAEFKPYFGRTKYIAYIALMGELSGVYYEDFEKTNDRITAASNSAWIKPGSGNVTSVPAFVS